MYSQMINKAPISPDGQPLFNYYQDCSLARMINFLNEAVLVINKEGRIEIVNSLAATLLGVDREYPITQNLSSFVNDASGSASAFIKTCLSGNKHEPLSSPPVEMCLRRDDGSLVSVEMSISTLPAELTFTDTLYICILHDLTLHKAEYGSLKRKANTDFLTGLANRHHFADYLGQQWDKCERENLPISVIFIDIDHFKSFNDQFGHIAGDRCLKRIGETISLSLPNRDTLAARYGGEEFALVLPNCTAQTAQLLAIRIKRHISQLSTRQFMAEQASQLTVSMGVATHIDGRYLSSEGLVNAADTLLYQAKSQGRDQICYL